MKKGNPQNGENTCVCMCSVASVMSNCDLWAVAHQAPLSMGFSRQEYWSGLPCPLPGNLPNPGIEPISLASPVSQAGSIVPNKVLLSKMY